MWGYQGRTRNGRLVEGREQHVEGASDIEVLVEGREQHVEGASNIEVAAQSRGHALGRAWCVCECVCVCM